MYPLMYQPYWIINKLCFGQVGWRILMFILLTYPYPQVSTQNFDYFYHHRAYRQSALPSYERINEPISLEPLVDDYTVDSGYKKAQLRLSETSDSGKPASLIGKDSSDYNIGIDDAISSVKALGSNDNLQRLYRSDGNNQHGDAVSSSFVKHNPSPSSQLKASGFNIDSSQPITMYARSSSAARMQTGDEQSFSNVLFVGSVIGVTFVGIFVVFATGYFVHRINLQRKAAADVEYPAYGVVGPGATIKEKEALSSVKTASGSSKGSSSSAGAAVCGAGSLSPSGDRRLAQSAQMYHYHHQKQQMISSEKVADAGQHPSTSDVDSDEEENEEGDYTVYECPGLASTGEMEVKNPLFQDDITPISSPSVSNTKQDGPSN